MLMIACSAMSMVMVAAMSERNGSVTRVAIRRPTQVNMANRAITRPAPRYPSSSPMIAKMKSLCAFGR